MVYGTVFLFCFLFFSLLFLVGTVDKDFSPHRKVGDFLFPNPQFVHHQLDSTLTHRASKPSSMGTDYNYD